LLVERHALSMTSARPSGAAVNPVAPRAP
jgi:hypothetical protein